MRDASKKRDLIKELTVILEDLWRQKSDKELEIAAKQLDHYTENAQQIILAELHKRGMIEEASKASILPQHPPQKTAQKYAEFWFRFAAFSIDEIILHIVRSLLIYAVLSLSKSGLLGIGVYIVTSWFYYAFSEISSEQATLGKQAMGIFVTDLEGNRISFGKATVRYFSTWLSTITLLLGYVMAAFTAKHQALHDLLAGTLVISKE